MARNSKNSEHQRTVSWDEGLLQVAPLIPRDVNLSRSVGEKSELSHDMLHSDPIECKNAEIALRASIRKNPLESEAENHILSAIEARDHLESEPEILNSVPDIAMNVFQNESMDGGMSIVSHATVHSKPVSVSVNGSVASKMDHTNKETHQILHHHHHHRKSNRGKTVEQLLNSVTKSIATLQGKQRSPSFEAKVDRILLDDPNAGSGDTLGTAANIIQSKRRNALVSKLPPKQNRADKNVKKSTVQTAEKKELRADWPKHSVEIRDNQRLIDPEIGSVDSSELDYSSSSDHDDDNHVNHEDKDARQYSVRLRRKVLHAVKEGIVGDFDSFIRQRQEITKRYAKFFVLVLLPAIALSCLLFYVMGNPPTGILNLSASQNNVLINSKGKTLDPTDASYSYWILFFVRLATTFTLAKVLEVFIIDFLCLGTKIMVNLFGNMITLWIILSRGWPFMAFSWALISWGLLEGSSRLVKHWLFWQSTMGVFNDQNPAGRITSNDVYHQTLFLAMVLGSLTSVKRLWVGLYLGRKTYGHYAGDLAKVMKKILLLCEVASLARKIEKDTEITPGFPDELPTIEECGMNRDKFERIVQEDEDMDLPTHGEMGETMSRSQHARNALLIDPDDYCSSGGLSDIQRAKINELLGEWEEPEKEFFGIEENISVSSVLQFRQSLSYLRNDFMFSFAWGEVSTRELCIISSQDVYKRLVSRNTGESLLSFDTLALIALLPDQTLDIEKMKELIRVLRPDRDGKLGMLDFVQSVDDVYKEARLLRASVKNSQKIDRALEIVINIVFYIFMALVALVLDPIALLAAVSTTMLTFAFIIGTASSKMFEGFLLILVRRPYDIGDRIHISNPDDDTDVGGSLSWVVKDIDLFSTTCVLGATGEKATLSNGALANSRIINMARSPNASLFVILRFPVDTPYGKIEIFEEALRKFVKSRPREWAQLLSFRARDVLQDQGYVEYIVFLQHRESWQNIGVLLMSRARVSSFCLELSKKLDMRYRSPPLPVDLTIAKKEHMDSESVIAKFQALSSTAGDDVACLFEENH